MTDSDERKNNDDDRGETSSGLAPLLWLAAVLALIIAAGVFSR